MTEPSGPLTPAQKATAFYKAPGHPRDTTIAEAVSEAGQRAATHAAGPSRTRVRHIVALVDDDYAGHDD
ncbi:hypothetical protein AX769_22490 (plasmid) [Frondihabitans sp. PAMC 28766]|uniref:hypothetical protein n=1 Tax=Frondihabitans sp. PAMC 28766 TaxID=1795630 RepID=UPI00078C02BD|nr:hypothetical protein [Frondihabitans sp. PAMC 28766]AMM22903.1 hypothetical protein AX769_22490 [Frondihabitans sp. PAMC 28766]